MEADNKLKEIPLVGWLLVLLQSATTPVKVLWVGWLIGGAILFVVTIWPVIANKSSQKPVSQKVAEKPNSRKRAAIDWAFDEYFLGMSATGYDIRIQSLQLRGTNGMKPFDTVEGYVQSDVTNAKIPILLDSMDPKKTMGIPANCEFRLNAIFPRSTPDREGMTIEEFQSQFGAFRIVLKLDGKSEVIVVDAGMVQNVIDRFRRDVIPQGPQKPRITPKAN